MSRRSRCADRQASFQVRTDPSPPRADPVPLDPPPAPESDEDRHGTAAVAPKAPAPRREGDEGQKPPQRASCTTPAALRAVRLRSAGGTLATLRAKENAGASEIVRGQRPKGWQRSEQVESSSLAYSSRMPSAAPRAARSRRWVRAPRGERKSAAWVLHRDRPWMKARGWQRASENNHPPPRVQQAHHLPPAGTVREGVDAVREDGARRAAGPRAPAGRVTWHKDVEHVEGARKVRGQERRREGGVYGGEGERYGEHEGADGRYTGAGGEQHAEVVLGGKEARRHAQGRGEMREDARGRKADVHMKDELTSCSVFWGNHRVPPFPYCPLSEWSSPPSASASGSAPADGREGGKGEGTKIEDRKWRDVEGRGGSKGDMAPEVGHGARWRGEGGMTGLVYGEHVGSSAGTVEAWIRWQQGRARPRRDARRGADERRNSPSNPSAPSAVRDAVASGAQEDIRSPTKRSREGRRERKATREEPLTVPPSRTLSGYFWVPPFEGFERDAREPYRSSVAANQGGIKDGQVEDVKAKKKWPRQSTSRKNKESARRGRHESRVDRLMPDFLPWFIPWIFGEHPVVKACSASMVGICRGKAAIDGGTQPPGTPVRDQKREIQWPKT
ncbi:hypothetical protein FB451DRAFT_1189960 [Mycena latifolia]|nr:hypothetical protein FB451DRAFT_1189960 [Mycena latifolia]